MDAHITSQSLSFDLSRQGDRIVFATVGDGGSDLYLLNLKNYRVSQLTQTPSYEQAPAFSPDGKSIVYIQTTYASDQKPDHVYLRSLDGKKVEQLTDGDTVFDSRPNFSWDGSQIIFYRAFRNRPYSHGGKFVWDHVDLCIMNADGTHLKRITHQNCSADYGVQFTPNDKNLIFSATQVDPMLHPRGLTQIRLVDVNGTQLPRALSPHEGMHPTISSDSRYIVATSDEDEMAEASLYRLNMEGTEWVQLTRDLPNCQNPVFAPDGKRVLFLTYSRAKGAELWQIDIDGRNLRRIADGGLFDDPLNWKPKPSG